LTDSSSRLHLAKARLALEDNRGGRMDVNIYTRTSSQATEKEKDTFVKLVKSRGAVNEEYVRNGVEREGTVMVFLKLGEEVVGVAALKVPSDEYRSGLGLKTKSATQFSKKNFLMNSAMLPYPKSMMVKAGVGSLHKWLYG
jgi:hypothetical protein